MDKEFLLRNLRLMIRDRELLTVSDAEIHEEMRILVSWVGNLDRLEQSDPEKVEIEFNAKDFTQKSRFFSRSEGSFWLIFHQTMESLLLSELKKRKIDVDKLHYGIGTDDGVSYEYRHIAKDDYDNLLSKHQNAWYKIVAVLPPYRLGLHKNTFYVPGARLNEFFDNRIYVREDKHNRIIHVEPISEEQYRKDIEEINHKVTIYKEQKYR